MNMPDFRARGAPPLRIPVPGTPIAVEAGIASLPGLVDREIRRGGNRPHRRGSDLTQTVFARRPRYRTVHSEFARPMPGARVLPPTHRVRSPLLRWFRAVRGAVP